ncbi:MAG: metallophosphoesterase [Candidatus Odinarchaeia archaeon]
MEIGVISDTHDNIFAVREAVKIFNEKEVSIVLHAGDIISPFVVKEFKKLYAPVTFILGNNEGELKHLSKVISEHNFNLSGRFYQDKLNGKRIAMVHGDIPIIDSLIKSKMYDIVISGHTHKKLLNKTGGVVHINPGEACGYLTGLRTIAIVNLNSMKVDFIEF